MNQMQVSYSAVIDARPQQVHAVISDYHVGHVAILPKPEFQELIVEQGGQGEGTVTRIKMKVMGREFIYHHKISEPEPGRTLKETDLDTGLGTLFTFEPVGDGSQTRVTITTDFPARSGLAGAIERWLTTRVTQRLYKRELDNLAAYLKR